jgi:hypothetical protein
VGELTRYLIVPGAPALANREARARVDAVAAPNFPEPHLRASAIAEQIKRSATVGLGHVLAAPLRSRHEDYRCGPQHRMARTRRHFQREKVPAGGASGQRVRNRDGSGYRRFLWKRNGLRPLHWLILLL